MIQARVNHLSHSYPKPDELKLKKYVQRLERLDAFYNERIPTAPEKQAWMFMGFISALNYSISIIHQYKALTESLSKLSTEGDRDAARSSSKG